MRLVSCLVSLFLLSSLVADEANANQSPVAIVQISPVHVKGLP